MRCNLPCYLSSTLSGNGTPSSPPSLSQACPYPYTTEATRSRYCGQVDTTPLLSYPCTHSRILALMTPRTPPLLGWGGERGREEENKKKKRLGIATFMGPARFERHGETCAFRRRWWLPSLRDGLCCYVVCPMTHGGCKWGGGRDCNKV